MKHPATDRCRPEVRAEVRTIEPYRPGKPLSSLSDSLSVPEEQWVRLASNENTLGAPPAAIAAAQTSLEALHRYPDGAGEALKAALAGYWGVTAEQITLGNGSNDVLDLVARCFLETGRTAIYSRHAFAVYELVVKISGATASVAAPQAACDAMPFGDNPEAIQSLITEDTAVIFIANPNNPTGTWLGGEQLKALLHAIPPTVIVVIDQAYAEYVEAPDYVNAMTWLDEFPNLVVTQTFSKIYALAGLRVGYAVSSVRIADWFNRIRQPFNVNVAAQAAAMAALDANEHIARSRAFNRAGLEQLQQGCDSLHLKYLPTAANFLCIEVSSRMPQIYDKLLEQGVFVRPVDNYGLPDYLRVTAGSEEENNRFIDALRIALDEEGA